MAEAFGVVAGVTGLLDVGSRLSKKIRAARKTWKTTASELHALHFDLEDLSVLLNMAVYVWRQLEQTIGNEDLGRALARSVDAAGDVVRHLEGVFDDVSALSETARKVAWLRQKGHVEAKMAELGRIRVNIREVLQMCGS